MFPERSPSTPPDARASFLGSLGAGGARARPGGRRSLRLGLGALWVISGLLQLQPGMFRMDMIGQTMAPTATPEPGWLSALVNWAVVRATAHLAPFNWTVALLEVVIGALLLSGRPTALRLGAGLALLWALALWLFGESLGQLLSGTATILSGAPGSMLLYTLAALLVLAPDSWWRPRSRGGPEAATAIVAAVLAAGALLQLRHLFWTPLGLAQPFANGAMMPQPHWLRALPAGAAALALRAPVTFNAALVVALGVLAIALVVLTDVPGVFWIALGALALLWVAGQDAGMLAGGMATDPNTAPVMALLLWAGRLARRGRAAP